MKCIGCQITIPKLPEDATQDEMLCDSCLRLKEWKEQLKTDRATACLRLAKAKVDEWQNDGVEEIVRCLACWMEQGLNLGDNDVLMDLAHGLCYAMENA